jgi:hypothetical protein
MNVTDRGLTSKPRTVPNEEKVDNHDTDDNDGYDDSYMMTV